MFESEFDKLFDKCNASANIAEHCTSRYWMDLNHEIAILNDRMSTAQRECHQVGQCRIPAILQNLLKRVYQINTDVLKRTNSKMEMDTVPWIMAEQYIHF